MNPNTRRLPGLQYVDHVAFTVPDLDDATRLFTVLLGAEELYESSRGPDAAVMPEHFGVPADAHLKLRMLRLPPNLNVELFQWWRDLEQTSELALYGRKLWETMSSYWPTGDQRPDATPAEQEFARTWRDTPKVVFSSTIDKVDWNARLVTGDAVAEITRLKDGEGRNHGHRRCHPCRAGDPRRADRRVRDRHPSGPGGRRHTVLHRAGRLGEPGHAGHADVPRGRGHDALRDEALSRCPELAAPHAQLLRQGYLVAWIPT